ncbi:MAG: hypothetical protein C5B56_03990 [Proteobacteria bacterium]|nr:MAG: hypothetical protein C5B56_03990 [Pseudomonadota bacterium]
MNATLLTTATLASVLAGMLPAKAADPLLLNLMMPDAKVLAGVNVDQAKNSTFGQYVLSQVQSQTTSGLQQLTSLTGFDPTRDVHELLAATNGGSNNHSGLVAATGTFDGGKFAALATLHGGKVETYGGASILEDPKQQYGVAFLSSTIVVAGDLANVKAAIDRQTTPQPLPKAIIDQVNKWSGTEDAWAISTVPPSSLNPGPGAIPIPGVGQQSGQNSAFQAIQSAGGGVKFGANVVVTAQVQADTAQNATNLGDTLKLLASMAQLQAKGDATVTALANSLNVSTSGTTLNVTVSLPQDMLQNLVKPHAAAVHRHPAEKK